MKIRAVRVIGCLLAATLLFTSVPVSAYTGEEDGVYLQEDDSVEAEAADEFADEDGSGEAGAVSDTYDEEDADDFTAEADSEADEELLSEDASENAEDSEKEDEEPLDELLYPEEDDADDFATSDDFEDEIPDEMTYDGDYDEFLAASGTEPGTGIKWSYSDDGTLTLSGTGAIRDYYKKDSGSTPIVDDRPWVSYWKTAKKLVISEGITRIGHRAFQNFQTLEVAELPNSLESIGQWAFQNCYDLTDVIMPENVSLENGAFRDAPYEEDLAATENDLYKDSTYYSNLTAVATTGSFRDDVIAIARSQIGYHEGNSESDYDGGNKSGDGDVSEYGRYLGSSGNAWCSEFASWCVRMAGVPTSQINSSKGANANTFTSGTSAAYHPWSETVWGGGNYRPGKGDIILWVWKGSSVTYAYDSSLSHTTLLESVSESGDKVTLNVVHGNSGNAVGTGAYVVNAADGNLSNGNGYVGYFVAPDYEKSITKYTVSFNANGGTVSRTSKKAAKGGLYGPLPVPEKNGAQFLGWYNSNGRRINMYSPCRLTSNETLTAHWSDASQPMIPSEYLRPGANISSLKPVSGTLKNSGEFGDGICAQIFTYNADGKPYRALYVWGEKGKGSIGKDWETVKSLYSGEKTSLTDIILDDSITKVAQQKMFSDLSLVSYVRLSENLKELAGRDFQSCSSLPEITFPASLEKAGMCTIDGCTSLKTMTFEQGIKKIPDQIAKCNVNDYEIALETVNIPSSVTEIGASAFAGQKKLTRVNFLDLANTTLARIGPFAFMETALSSITLPKFGGSWKDTSDSTRYPEISGRAFDNMLNPAFKTIIIPEGVVNLYEFTHDCTFEYIYLPTTIENSDTKQSRGFSEAIFYDDDNSRHKALKKIYYPGSEAQFLKKALGAKIQSAVENYKARFWYDKVVFNTKAPSQVENISAESDSLVYYSDEITDGKIETVKLAIDPADHLSATYKVTSSDTKIVEASIGSEANGYLNLILKLHNTKIGQATVTVTGGSGRCDITVVIKDKEKTLQPYKVIVSGDGTEYGDLLALRSQTPNAQIFYVINSKESPDPFASAAFTWNSTTERYTCSAGNEYKQPLVIGEDITASKNYIHAVAIRRGLKESGHLNEEVKIASVDPWGDVTEDDQKDEFGNNPEKLKGAAYQGIWVPKSQLKDITYTGKAITIPDLRVYYKTTLLTLKQDYTLSFSNNTDAAAADSAKPPTITIALTGNYSGKEIIHFTINKKKLSLDDFTSTDVLLGVKLDKDKKPVAQTVDPKLTYQGKALKVDTDYVIYFRMVDTYGDWEKYVLSSGIYDARITFQKNYTGQVTLFGSVNVLGGESVAMDKVQVSSIKEQKMADWSESGYVVKPVDITVKYKGKAVDNSQYGISYEGNTAAGTATIILTGTGKSSEGCETKFIGTKTVKFKIKGLPFDDRNVTIDGIAKKYMYTRSDIEPVLSVKYKDGKIITSDSEKNGYYKVTYNNGSAHKDAGKVSMIIEGAGIYEGKVKRDFTIEKIPMDSADISASIVNDSEEGFSYTKNGVKPAVEVTFKSPDGKKHKLQSPSDYTVAYKNNNKPGLSEDTDNRGKSIAPAITITGKGSFQGSRTLTFTIRKAELSELDMSLEDMAFVNAPKKYARKPVITDANGTVLREGTDYDKVFEYTYDSDTTITRVEGKGKSAVTKKYSRKKGDKVDDLDIISAGSVIRVKVNAKDGGCYKGSIERTFVVADYSVKDLKFTISKSYDYTGRPITPLKNDIEVQKKNGRNWDKLSADEAKKYYDIISYSNNIKKGTATVVVKAKNGYAGTAKVTFKINAKAK